MPAAAFTVRTPSGGHHLYFTAAEADVRNSAGRLGPLIDVRAVGGYVVAPPSHIGGKPYAVTNAVPPAPLPSWIAALLADSRPGKGGGHKPGTPGAPAKPHPYSGDERLAVVLTLLRSGSEPSAAELAAAWNTSPRTAGRIIRAAKDLLQA